MSDDLFLTLTDLTLAYGDNAVVEGLNLSIRKGELIALLGPSGCGKSTTMRSIAGLLMPRIGEIRLDGVDITHTSPNKREVGLVFQSYALFPHLSVFENVAFGLRLKKMDGASVAKRVEEGLVTVDLQEFADRKPAELSGGQQQRVALARSLVMDPKVLLLDEPLSNLDARLRLEMRTELQRIHRESGQTMIFVTHDQGEAMAMADRIVVMNEGKIEQIGTPEEIYNAPVSRFVADFVGFENIFGIKDGKIETAEGPVTPASPISGNASGLAWRPLMVSLGEGPFEGEVLSSSFAGNTREYLLQSPFGHIKAEEEATRPIYAIGSKVTFDLPIKSGVVLERMG